MMLGRERARTLTSLGGYRGAALTVQDQGCSSQAGTKLLDAQAWSAWTVTCLTVILRWPRLYVDRNAPLAKRAWSNASR